MARQVLPWVGAAVGAIWGQPQLGFAIGSLIGNAVDPQVIKGPQLGEGQANTASEGGYRPIVLGKGAVGVCMIHQGPEIIKTIRHRQSKGGGPKTEEQRRYRTMAFALGESAYPETGVQLLRLWIDNKLVYDVTPTSQIPAESAEFAQRFTFYPGNETQEPDPDLEAMPVDFGGGVGNVPSYRGGCPYIVFPEYDVTDSVGRAPMIKAELSSNAQIVVMSALAQGNSEHTHLPFLANSPDGDTWSAQGPSNAIEIIALDANRFFAVAGDQSFYTDDYGVTRTTVPLDGFGGPHRGDFRNGILLIAGSSAGIWRSTDRGETCRIVPDSPISDLVAMAQGFAVSMLLATARRSLDDGLTWSGEVDTGLWIGNIPNSIASTTDAVAVCGRSYADFPATVPAVSITRDGASWTVRTIPESTGSEAIAVKGHKSGTDTIWIVACGDSKVYWSNDDFATYHECADEMNVNDIAHNGSTFILVGNTLGGSAGAAIATTTDGQSLTLASSFPYTEDVIVVSASDTPYVEMTAGPIPLSYVISFLHDRVGIPPSKYNVTELTDIVEGVVFADGYTGAAAMQSAMGVYSFGAGEYDAGSGYKLNYVKHGKPAVVTLTEDDVVEGPEDWEREDSYERPRVLHVAYPNPIADYGAPNIVIKRTSPDVLVVGERSVSVPFVFSDADEITRKADVMMTVIYTEIAGTYKLVLPWSLLTLAPTDPIGFSIRGRTRRLRLEQWRFSPDGTISTEFMADRQSAWTSNVTGLPAVPSTPPPPSIVGPTASAALDIPALTDSLDSLHQIVAASGMTPAWYGSDHQRKLPSDADFTTMLRFTGVTTIMGTLQDDVTAASPHFTDTTNVVRVTLYRDDELVTHTQQQFLSEGGAFALSWDDGGVRRWEVGQYRDAVKVGDQEWELTTLARGRLNTDAEAHPAGSLFVLLDAGVRAMPMQSSMIGQDITHRAVSLGKLPDQAVPYTEPYTGESQREWPVAHLFVERDGDDIDCTCVPRHRFGTDDNPIRSANWSGYRWTATDGSNTVTADTLSETHTFDVSGWASPVTVTVAQLNRITGAGPVVSEEIA